MSKKNFIIFIVVAFILIISTYAYASSNERININNVTQTFNSPSNWKPGDVTPNKVRIKNTTNKLLVARVQLNQKWVSKNNRVLDIKQNENDTVLFDYDKDNFIFEGGYYYYKKVLNPNDEVLFLRSVIFNPEVTNDYVCITEEKGNTKTQRCDSSGNGYDDAKYTLVIKIDTIEYDNYKLIWNTNIDIK